MDGKRRWLGWIAIGLGAAALIVALIGRGFGSQIGAAGRPGAIAQQQNAQPQAGPDAGQQNAQPRAGRQGEQAGPGGEARRGGGRPGDGGFGRGGGPRLPFKLIGGSFQWVMLALLLGLGVWMIRGRNNVAASTGGRADPAQAPAQAPLSPTGEAYIEEPNDSE
ncbi:MAG: hypothetical protein ABIV47_24550 [Roseiflexaceae bacterium]